MKTADRGVNVLIRTENHHDYKNVFNLHYSAFGNREDESRLIERIRKSDGFIRELSIVIEQEGLLVGHILISKAKVMNEQQEKEVLVLAPIAVDPQVQRSGIGKKLMEEGIRRSKELGFGLIFLIGHPTYYPKFGFKPAREFGLELKQYKVPDDVFMVVEIRNGELEKVKGELLYPEVFF
ncbi:GNAT family N-acetyltransferase [Bacillus pinisoli]|uniref:GNAT family N-acetyltransferase n=1 Tax=Bacillus pinisoli TaxID=2901866 RepID=UPI001FF353D6|nr:N-acetyltransferase [Bacillus pinisoli]